MLSRSPWTVTCPFFPVSMTVERYRQSGTDRMQNAKGPATPGEPFIEHRDGGASGYTSVLFAGDVSVNRWQSLSVSHSPEPQCRRAFLAAAALPSFVLSVRHAGVRERRVDPPGIQAAGSASLGRLSHLWCSKPFLTSSLTVSMLDCRSQGQ